MYGYIRPLPGELKVREFEHFKACYCGLCRALGEKYGVAARFVLNFELVFLAMLLWRSGEDLQIKRKCCIASMCKKRMYCVRNETLDNCAGYSVILAWWKLRDSIADERFIKTIPYRIASLFLIKAYKKAREEFCEFDNMVRLRLGELGALEVGAARSGGVVSFDELADKFALIISSTVPKTVSESEKRILTELLYHTGRWIYIIDACDDYKSDISEGRFNPVALRYPPEGGALPEEGVVRLRTTLNHSNNLLSSAFELLGENPWTQTVGNIVYLGMPNICEQVLDGKWRRSKTKNKEWS